MQNEQRPRGRPRFRIDPDRLRQLREARGLSQLELAKLVYRRAGETETEAHVMKSMYQRWERKGAMPRQTAQHLAEELATTLEVLQGLEPLPLVGTEIKERLRLGQAGGNAAVKAALLPYADGDDPVGELAQSVTARLEAAQLSQDHVELAELASLTGLTPAQLRRPVGGQGHWLLIGTGPLGAHRTEILQGIDRLANELHRDLEDCLGTFHESDGTVSIHEDKPWFRIEVRHPRIAKLTRTLRFVRAQASDKGLMWMRPTTEDRRVLNELPGDLWRLCNFVSGFSPQQSSCHDLARLRLVLQQPPTLREMERFGLDPPARRIAVVGLAADEPPAHAVESFKREGNVHSLRTILLANRMWDALEPLLAALPLECWRLTPRGGRVEVSLDGRLYQRLALQRGEEPRFGAVYEALLAEEAPGGELRQVPWRDADVAEACEKLQWHLDRARKRAGEAPAAQLLTP